jgi:hypothetical protein
MRHPRSSPHPLTGEFHEWTVTRDGTSIPWRCYAGPVRLDAADFARACRALVAVEPADVQDFALNHIEIASDDGDRRRLILHSTTPTTRGFETDLAAMAEGRVPVDITTYTEARALYFARAGDLVVGRTRAWRLTPAKTGVERLALDDTDHYYMSHALLQRAVDHGDRDPALARLIAYLREHPALVVSLYDFEPEMQVLVGWLARTAGIRRVRVNTNDPRLIAWNRKGVLHPTVDAALGLDVQGSLAPRDVLKLEHKLSVAFQDLAVPLPVLPGYTVPRRDGHDTFCRDLLRAGALLAERYGLSQVCLKPSEGGDGGRIVPGIDLGDRSRLENLASWAWTSGGDQVVQAHVDYLQKDVGGSRVPVAPSAHLAGGVVLDGLTLQFMRGTSWKGNIYVDIDGWRALGLDHSAYVEMRSVMVALTGRLCNRGLVQAGVDFAVGTLGGRFGDDVVVAVQDINAKLTGATFLREFMARQPTAWVGAATRVFRPHPNATPAALHQRLSTISTAENTCEIISVVPGRWGMLAATAQTSAGAGETALALERTLITEGLATDPLAG